MSSGCICLIQAHTARFSQPKAMDRLEKALEAGGKMLFTDYAAFLPYDLGMEAEEAFHAH